MRHRHGEDVRTLLLEKRCFLSGLLRLLVGLARLLLLLDLAFNHPLADHHTEGVDRRAFGQREDVNTFDPLIRGIAEGLHHPSPADEPGHVDAHLRLHGGCRDIPAVYVRAQQQAPHPDVGGRDRLRPCPLLHRRRTRRREQHEDGEAGESSCVRALHWILPSGALFLHPLFKGVGALRERLSCGKAMKQCGNLVAG